MNWDVQNIEGKVIKSVELDDEVFGVDMNEALLHSVIIAYQANKRQGTHATKTRSLVSGGGKKPFRQKGTGNARQGSKRSPLMPGGGTAHGPQPRQYTKKLSVKMRQQALKVALSDKVRAEKLIVVDNFKVDGYKTKAVQGILSNLSLTKSKVLFVDRCNEDFLYRSSRNIHGARACQATDINSLDILHATTLVFSEAALEGLSERLSGEA